MKNDPAFKILAAIILVGVAACLLAPAARASEVQGAPGTTEGLTETPRFSPALPS